MIIIITISIIISSIIVVVVDVVVVRPVMITTFVEPHIVPETTMTNEMIILRPFYATDIMLL